AFLYSRREMPGACLSWPAPDFIRDCLDPGGGAIHFGAAKLPAFAGVFEHRPRWHYGRGAWIRRQARRLRRSVTHVISFGGQAAHVFLRRQRTTELRFALLSPDHWCDPHFALDRRVISYDY